MFGRKKKDKQEVSKIVVYQYRIIDELNPRGYMNTTIFLNENINSRYLKVESPVFKGVYVGGFTNNRLTCPMGVLTAKLIATWTIKK